uniref:MATH domain-containing protein n=1 Tax=Leersia perrieri TaxID=77586 RepID=A0A0D9W2W5_9ORYZ
MSTLATATATGRHDRPPPHVTSCEDLLYSYDKVLTMNIDSYKEATKLAPNGKNIRFPKLNAGGYSWYILFYPNGRLPGTTDSMSLFLQLAEAPDDGTYVKFKYQFMLERPQGDSPGIEFISGSVVASANKQWNSHGFERYVSREDLRKRGLIKADYIRVRCDVSLLERKKTSLSVDSPPAPQPSHQPKPAQPTVATSTSSATTSSPSWRMEIP